MKIEQAKNCPFCDSDDIRVTSIMATMWYVVCDDCLAEGPVKENESDAIEDWNKRVDSNG
jgi:Lar family restriction alleviation protein